jgi:hypothetical protein
VKLFKTLEIYLTLTEEGAARYTAYWENQYQNGPPSYTPVEVGYVVKLNKTGFTKVFGPIQEEKLWS